MSVSTIPLVDKGHHLPPILTQTVDFGINLAEGIIFRAISGKFGGLFVSLSTGHLFQLFVSDAGLNCSDNQVSYRCWRLLEKKTENTDDSCYPVYHIEEILDRSNSNTSLTLAVSHYGQNIWVYEIAFQTDGNVGKREIFASKGVELSPRASTLASVLDRVAQYVMSIGSEPQVPQVLKSKYVGGNIICALVACGVRQEVKLISLASGEVVASLHLKMLDIEYGYEVLIIYPSSQFFPLIRATRNLYFPLPP